MKKITLLLTALFLFGVTFGQMKYVPTKTIIVILGAQNPHIDYTRFSDIEFYFTPELDNLYNDAKSLSDATGMKDAMKLFKKNTSASKQQEVLNAYNGPNDVIFKKGLNKTSYLFDKEGTVYGKFWGANPEFISGDSYLVKNRSQDSETLKGLLKELVKKEDTRKLGKIKKGKDYSWQPGYKPTSITVVDKDGNNKELINLLKGNAATLLYCVHVNSKFDPVPGKESGEGKDPDKYNEDVAKTMVIDKQLKPIYDIEENIYGKKLNK